MKLKGLYYLALLLWVSFRDRNQRRAVKEKYLSPAPDMKWLMEEALRLEALEKKD